VLADGGLQSLPFSVLVTKDPPPINKELMEEDQLAYFTVQDEDLEAYRNTPWLIDSYAVSTIPAVSSLAVLRALARRSTAPDPLIAFGDPLLGGDAGTSRGLDPRLLFKRGTVADTDAVRQLPRLPDTATELQSLARTLRAGKNALYLRAEATEQRVRTVSLDRARVVAFATHGLMAGEFGQLAEPALVLTPPAQATATDDGLLTASEIAQLRLNADWVVLSACNTAAADGTPGAEGLSGLAKAFFYAGTRALVVSHWAVFSDAARRLTTAMFAEAARNPGLGRAETLRRAMRTVRSEKDHPEYAHPTFWAPFVVVGEGGGK